MCAAHGLIRGCPKGTQTMAQRAVSLNTQGMINIALGDHASAARHLEEAAAIAEGFGHALTSHIEDNMAFLCGSVGGDIECALERLRWLQEHMDALDPTMLCSVYTHEGTTLRRSGDAKEVSVRQNWQ